jgi:hypothetical protein
MRKRVDLKQLEKELDNLHYWQPLYRLLRTKLDKLGYWKNKVRGNPSKGYKSGWGKHRR